MVKLERSRVILLVALLLIATVIISCSPKAEPETVVEKETVIVKETQEVMVTATPEPIQDLKPVVMRLGWVNQAEYLGYYVALDKGFFKEVGLDVTIHPGGPEIRPPGLVAAGEDFATVTFAEVLIPRSNGVPLVWLYTYLEEGLMNYVTKKELTGIEDWSDLPGHNVSLWFGGGEVEFLWCLNQLGIDKDSLGLEPQHLGMAPFLADTIDVAVVTTYNELNELYEKGVKPEELTILNPNDVGCALPGYGLFTRESLIESDPQLVQDFVNQSIRGWKFCKDNPEEAMDILMKYCPECDRPHQTAMLNEIIRLMTAGDAPEYGIGYTNLDDFKSVLPALEFMDLLGPEKVDIDKTFDPSFWEKVPDEYKKF